MRNQPPDGKEAILKGEDVVVQNEPVSVPSGEVPRRPAVRDNKPQRQAEVDVTRAEDGTVQTITVRCPCGREIALDCEYPGKGEDNEQVGS